MRREAWGLSVASGATLIAGLVHVGLSIREDLQHPGWSLPLVVDLLYLVPFVLVSVLLGCRAWRVWRL